MNELVSVLMPAKNAAMFIEKSIHSVLNQTYSNLELIIINDRSTDNTLEIIQSIKDSRIKVVNGPGTGISDAFNTGLAAARGQFLCRCDADDLYPANRLETQVIWLTQHKEYIAVCGMYSSIDTKDKHLIQYNRDAKSINLDQKFSKGITRTHFCTFMTQTEVLKEIHGCRAFFETAEDIDLQLRLSQQGSIFFLAENFYLYRLHDLSITHTQSNGRREFFEKFARDCHQQRIEFGYDDLELGKTPTIPNLFSEPNKSNQQITNQLISESWYWHKQDNKKNAVKSAYRALKLDPMRWNVWKNLVVIFLKP